MYSNKTRTHSAPIVGRMKQDQSGKRENWRERGGYLTRDKGTTKMDAENTEQHEPEKGTETKGRVCTGLATLPAQTLLDETALADALGTCKRTIRRMVSRYELPPAVRFGGRSTWQAGAVLRWFEGRAERAAQHAERMAKKLSE